MLTVLLVTSAVFFIDPIIQDYPDDARVFPQLTAAAVFIGTALLLTKNYLPGPLQTFVAGNVSIMTDEPDVGGESGEESESESTDQEDEGDSSKETLGTKYGIHIDDTTFMVVTAVLFFIAGWAIGFLYVAPVYVLFYTLWYRVNVVKSVFLAILATVIMYGFVWALIMPFDQGNLIDLRPFLPLYLDGLTMGLPWGDI